MSEVENVENRNLNKNTDDDLSNYTFLIFILVMEIIIFIGLVIRNSNIDYPEPNDGTISNYEVVNNE